MWTQLKVSGRNGEIGSGTGRQRADPAGIRQLAQIKLGLVCREQRRNPIRARSFWSRRTIQKLITSAKWNPHRRIPSLGRRGDGAGRSPQYFIRAEVTS